jgi:hypothetical protein
MTIGDVYVVNCLLLLVFCTNSNCNVISLFLFLTEEPYTLRLPLAEGINVSEI